MAIFEQYQVLGLGMLGADGLNQARDTIRAGGLGSQFSG